MAGEGLFDPELVAASWFDEDQTVKGWFDGDLIGNPFVGITFIASSTTINASGSNTLVINKPAGTVDGDLMIAVMDAATAGLVWGGDTGWTEAYDQGASPRLRIAYKVAASEGASYTFSIDDFSAICGGSILTYRNAAYDVIGAAFVSSGTTPIVAPSITAVGGLLLAIYGKNTASTTFTTPSGMSSVVSNATTPCFNVFSETIAAGATGSRTSTPSTTGGATAGILLSLKPNVQAYSITANSGSYAVTGQAAGVYRNRTLATTQGSYALTGQAASVYKNRALAAAQGSYAITGQKVGRSGVIYQTTYEDVNNLTAYTFSVVWDGSSSDVLVLCPQSEHSTSGTTAAISSLTFNGVAITAQVISSNINASPSGVYTVTGISAGTYSCVVTYSATMARAVLGVWRLLGFSPTAKYTNSATAASGAGLSTTVNLAAGEIAISGYTAGDNPAVTWTGALSDYSTTTSENLSQFAGATTTSATSARTGHTISTTSSGSMQQMTLVAAVFGPPGYTIAAVSGSYAVTGQTTGIYKGRVLAAAQGGYAVTGQTSTILRSKLLVTAQGNYAVAGQSIGVYKGRALSATQGLYALTGQAVTLLRSKSLSTSAGSYSVTGQAAGVYKGRTLSAAQGSYAVTGQDATIVKAISGYTLTAVNGAYTLTGQTVSIVYGSGGRRYFFVT